MVHRNLSLLSKPLWEGEKCIKSNFLLRQAEHSHTQPNHLLICSRRMEGGREMTDMLE